MRKISLFLALSLFVATVAFAAEGKVKSVNDDKITVEMSDTAKLKKGASVKINGKTGKITSMDGTTITIKANKASELKAGEVVKVDKVNSMQGC
jgi:ABC-type transporter Mla subunit MlaD